MAHSFETPPKAPLHSHCGAHLATYCVAMKSASGTNLLRHVDSLVTSRRPQAPGSQSARDSPTVERPWPGASDLTTPARNSRYGSTRLGSLHKRRESPSSRTFDHKQAAHPRTRPHSLRQRRRCRSNARKSALWLDFLPNLTKISPDRAPNILTRQASKKISGDDRKSTLCDTKAAGLRIGTLNR